MLIRYLTHYHKIKNTYINCSKVETITLLGGLWNIHRDILQQNKDPEKIRKIINLLNSCKDRAKSEDKEISSLKNRVGYPPILSIKLKNGDSIRVQNLLYRYKSKAGYSVMMDEDKVIIIFERMGKLSFCTLKSEELVNYISKEAARDIPKGNS